MVNRETLIAEFRRRFPDARPTALVRAPGRVNLIGEHVDYNGGLVMPLAIDLAHYAVAGPRPDEMLIAHSLHTAETIEIDGAKMSERRTGWAAYLQGVVCELQRSGIPLYGANVVIGGDLPVGAGLSSSAALEVAIALALLHTSGASLSREKVAECCRTAEHDYADVPCGIMDQFACLLAKNDHVMLIDCKDESVGHISWPVGDNTILIIDSRSAHRLSSSLYAHRVDECRKAERDFSWFDGDYPMPTYRMFSLAKLDRIAGMMEQSLVRRARHVLSEIERVQAAAKALESADFEAFGELMNESHRSLAIDFEVSSPQMDELARIVRAVPGVHGARLCGGGFGGCVVAVAPKSVLPNVESAVRSAYDKKYGVSATVMTTRPCEGATVHPLV